MTWVTVKIGSSTFRAKLLRDTAPRSCTALESMLPFASQLIHARWSGEACWVSLGDRNRHLPPENATSYPPPGTVLLYPGGASEGELLFVYGAVRFASKAGQLAGNPVLALEAADDKLVGVCCNTLVNGACDVAIY